MDLSLSRAPAATAAILGTLVLVLFLRDARCTARRRAETPPRPWSRMGIRISSGGCLGHVRRIILVSSAGVCCVRGSYVRTVSRLPVSDRLSAEAPCCADPVEHRELRRLSIGKWMSMLEWNHCDGRPEDSPPRRQKLPRMEPAHGFVEYLGHEQGVRGVCSARQALRCACMLSAYGVLLMHPTYCAGMEACTQIWCLLQDRGSSGFIESRSSLCQISYTVHKTRVKVREPGHSYRRMRI